MGRDSSSNLSPIQQTRMFESALFRVHVPFSNVRGSVGIYCSSWGSQTAFCRTHSAAWALHSQRLSVWRGFKHWPVSWPRMRASLWTTGLYFARWLKMPGGMWMPTYVCMATRFVSSPCDCSCDIVIFSPVWDRLAGFFFWLIYNLAHLELGAGGVV